MENLFLVSDQKQLRQFQAFVTQHEAILQKYINYLQENFKVQDLPQAIIWADSQAAMQVIRECPVPAYTNDVRLVITPDLHVWQTIYLKQLESYSFTENLKEVQAHYQALSTNYVLQIIGHELAHQSEWFLEEAEDSLWFEEGMVEYISRRYFLTEKEFRCEKASNQKLVQQFQAEYGHHPLSQFGQATYMGNYASIFYEYWRSFLAIDSLVERLGTVEAVFSAYHKWDEDGRPVDLLTWFALDI